MRTASRLVGIIGPLLLAVALASCSMVKLGYNRLDDVAYWWLDSYLDFNDSQTPRVRDDLARLLAWHRSNELPRFADMLQAMERLAPGDITPEQACGFVTAVKERLNVLADQAEPAVVALATSLTAPQLRHLERKYQKSNADYRKEWIEPRPEEQKDKRAEQMQERSEMIYGRLDDPQIAVLRKYMDSSAFDAQRVLAERERRQQDAVDTLRKVTNPLRSQEEARRLMRGFLERVQASPDAAYRVYQEQLIQEGCRTFAATHNSTTAAQRENAVRRLRAYQRDLRELATQR